MGKHYIPQFLLRGFTHEGALHAFDKARTQWFRSQPKSVANERDLWPDEVETFITEEVEGPARDAIERLRQRESLTEQDRWALARYIAFLWKRVPAGRDRFLNNIPGVAEALRRELIPKLANEELRIKANAYIDKNIADPSAALWHESMRTEFKRDVEGTIARMSWEILHTKEPRYLSSDHPVFFFSTDGIGRPTSELTIAFSSRAALICRHGGGNIPRHTDAQPRQVREVNKRTVSNATRFIFSETRESWMTDFVEKAHLPARGGLS